MKNIKKSSIFKPLQFMAVVLTLIFAGCCPHAETYKVPDSFKTYFSFPVGSYWVYKNQYGNYDTLKILNVNSEIKKMNAEDCDKYEKITTYYKSTYFGNFNLSTKYTSFFMLCELNKNYFTELTDFGKYTNGEQKAQSCRSQIEWWIEDTVVINNKNYYNVVVNKTTSYIPPSITDYPLKGYFFENIGLIKRELQNGEIWELVDYKINR